MTKSKKTSKTRPQFDFQMQPKMKSLLSKCFWIIAMHSFYYCSLPVWKRSSLKKGTWMTYFGPALDRPLGGSGCTTTTLVRNLEYFTHDKFHQNPAVKRFWRRSWKCKLSNGQQTTDGHRTTRDHNRSLEPSASVPYRENYMYYGWGIKIRVGRETLNRQK